MGGTDRPAPEPAPHLHRRRAAPPGPGSGQAPRCRRAAGGVRLRAGHPVPTHPHGLRCRPGAHPGGRRLLRHRGPHDCLACRGGVGAGGVPHPRENLRGCRGPDVRCAHRGHQKGQSGIQLPPKGQGGHPGPGLPGRRRLPGQHGGSAHGHPGGRSARHRRAVAQRQPRYRAVLVHRRGCGPGGRGTRPPGGAGQGTAGVRPRDGWEQRLSHHPAAQRPQAVLRPPAHGGEPVWTARLVLLGRGSENAQMGRGGDLRREVGGEHHSGRRPGLPGRSRGAAGGRRLPGGVPHP